MSSLCCCGKTINTNNLSRHSKNIEHYKRLNIKLTDYINEQQEMINKIETEFNKIENEFNDFI